MYAFCVRLPTAIIVCFIESAMVDSDIEITSSLCIHDKFLHIRHHYFFIVPTTLFYRKYTK